MARAKGASVQTVDKHTLNQLSGNRPHQVLSWSPTCCVPTDRTRRASGSGADRPSYELRICTITFTATRQSRALVVRCDDLKGDATVMPKGNIMRISRKNLNLKLSILFAHVKSKLCKTDVFKKNKRNK